MIRMQITEGKGILPERSEADLIQVREPQLAARELAAYVRALSGRRILVNDRLDVALATHAAGVHIRSNGVSPISVRRITPKDFLISVACHTEEDVLRAAQEGADYAVLAPIFEPRSKPMNRPPLGLTALREIAKHARIPILALGGVTNENIQSCLDAGAAGVAAITLFR